MWFAIFLSVFTVSSILFIVYTVTKGRNPEPDAITINTYLPKYELKLPDSPKIIRTIDGKAYTFHDDFWFLQFPVDDTLSLELCVGYGCNWIYTIEPLTENDVEEYDTIEMTDIFGNMHTEYIPTTPLNTGTLRGTLATTQWTKSYLDGLTQAYNTTINDRISTFETLNEARFEMQQNFCDTQRNLDLMAMNCQVKFDELEFSRRQYEMNKELMEKIKPITIPYYPYPGYIPTNKF